MSQEGDQPERPHIALFQCLPKARKLDLIIRQATETGVKEIIPVLSNRTVPQKANDGEEKKLARLAVPVGFHRDFWECGNWDDAVGSTGVNSDPHWGPLLLDAVQPWWRRHLDDLVPAWLGLPFAFAVFFFQLAQAPFVEGVNAQAAAAQCDLFV